jgi:hypothetical protein
VTKLDDALLDKIANGNGRCYPHEGKAMAQELIEFRKAAAEAAKAATTAKLTATQPIPNPGLPFPWGGAKP